jgi:hypothetical protein
MHSVDAVGRKPSWTSPVGKMEPQETGLQVLGISDGERTLEPNGGYDEMRDSMLLGLTFGLTG